VRTGRRPVGIVGYPVCWKSVNQSSEAVLNAAVSMIRVGTKSKSPKPRELRGSSEASPPSSPACGFGVPGRVAVFTKRAHREGAMLAKIVLVVDLVGGDHCDAMTLRFAQANKRFEAGREIRGRNHNDVRTGPVVRARSIVRQCDGSGDLVFGECQNPACV